MMNTIMNGIKIGTALSLVTLMVNPSFAEEKEDTRSPTGCNDSGYQFDLKTLKLAPENLRKGQSLYIIYNNSAKPITLFQMRQQDSSRSMYFNHRINGANWAVLATCEKKMHYICTEDDPKSSYGKIVDCKDSLKICEYSNVKFGLNNKGNYWLVNSNSKNAAVREIVRYGIIPSIRLKDTE